MRLNPRPAKIFLFNTLQRKLKNYKKGVALDAASAGMKNRRMFKTDFYYGLDIKLDRLREALGADRDEREFGIYADLLNINSLPSSSVDLIVSTNTLYIFSPKEREEILQNLTRLTAPEGVLVCEILKDKNFKILLQKLRDDFSKVKVIYFGNIFSRAYGRLVVPGGRLRHSSVATSKPFMILSWLISRLEYLTFFIPFLNKHALIICTGKNTKQEKKDFDLSKFNIIDNYVYDLVTKK